jgi:hypothetical protein
MARQRRYVTMVREDGWALPLHIRRCDTFACRLRGLTFRRSLAPDEGLLFVEAAESRMGTSIHMFFVFFAIGVVWLDAEGTVVDTVVARPFRPFYAPQAPARYFLEGPPSLVEQVAVGDRFRIEDEG